ncbi:MAG: hypothetical protein IKJ92_10970 [Bacteroidaceae bacterium]|nr:hypothetical protein [Bacteroidaceae bacterium]
MRTILLTALCAVAIGTQAKVANDTIDKYIIDKQPIEHFDGSQLEGKCISKYMIAYKQGKGVVEKHHVIYTDAKIVRLTGNDDKSVSVVTEPLLIVDGKEISPEDFAKLNSQAIDHIDVLKAGSKAAEETFGEKGKNGVIIVTTKATKSNATTDGEVDFLVYKALIIVDGKETSPEDFAKLKPESSAEYAERFASMEIFKPGSKEAKSYGEKGRNGVIIVKTKGGKKSK